MMKKASNHKKNYYVVIGILLLMIFWTLASAYNWLGNTLLASPKEVYGVIKNSFGSHVRDKDKFYLHAWYTIVLSFKGWIISLFYGFLLGLILGSFRTLYDSFEVVFEFFRSIPPIFAFPLMLVAFRFDNRAYVWTIVFGCLPVIVLTISRGVKFISRQSLEVLKINNVSPIVRTIASGIEVLPNIFLGARLAFSISLIIAVVCEMVTTPNTGFGIGSFARDSELNFDAPVFYTCVLTIGLYGYIINLILKKIENFLGTTENND